LGGLRTVLGHLSDVLIHGSVQLRTHSRFITTVEPVEIPFGCV
jgi:hypothetical protein